MFCTHCGSKTDANSKFCTTCGTPKDQTTAPSNARYHVPSAGSTRPTSKSANVIVSCVLAIAALIGGILLINSPENGRIYRRTNPSDVTSTPSLVTEVTPSPPTLREVIPTPSPLPVVEAIPAPPAPASAATPAPPAVVTPAPPAAAATPAPPLPVEVASPDIQGEPFFETLSHFQELIPFGRRHGPGMPLRLGTVTSLGVNYLNSLHVVSSVASGGIRDYNLNGQFTTLTGTVLRLDVGGWDNTITFTGDGRNLGTFQANTHDQPRPISIDVTGVYVLRITIYGAWVAFTNVGIQRCPFAGVQPPGNIVISHGEPFFDTVNHFHEGPSHMTRTMQITASYSLGVRYENSLIATRRPWQHDTRGYRDFNLNSQFTTISGTIIPIDHGGGFGSITFIGDGQRLEGFLRGSFDEAVRQPVQITVDVTGVNILRISIDNEGFAFTNAMIYR